ncbi:putative DNA-binding domain-containing protein [Stenotrophomonas sp. HITSZ_GD]|uniref:HvfC family RiPP maturation protein n=1 Tax=Stenotrophomonas sp. HITSZ_GD TaxID=3037248 RepID=UPI00240D4A1D|nr:putative DNA-binding domain-containing protein [Stenotrophomonas sp. HITSZ_GD]MDG2526740.1 putative DNA-binding domain-containing protein [Stenotrophomonas sp. HITSZ_GD]
MSTLQAQQHAFAAYLRDPGAHAPPQGFDPEAAALYRQLFRRNIGQLLAANFPVIRATLAPDAWDALGDAFCRDHRARTPVFPRFGAEFVSFLEHHPLPGHAPWLAELARHEWTEQSLRIDDTPLPAHDPQGDLLAGIPVCSPWLRLESYRWPVHRIGPTLPPPAPLEEPVWLLARRDAQGQVRFAELGAWTARLLHWLDAPGPDTGGQRLRHLAREAGAEGDEVLLAHAEALLRRLHAQGSVLGTRIGT